MPGVTQPDRPRLLSRRSEYGYTHLAAEALPGEPEAVDAETQAAFSVAARHSEAQRQRDEWARAHRQISGALQAFHESGPDLRVANAVRAVERAAARVDHQVGL